MQQFHHRFSSFLNLLDVSLLCVHDRDVYSQIKEKKNMLTKIDLDISSRNKVDIENYHLCFFNVALEEKLR